MTAATTRSPRFSSIPTTSSWTSSAVLPTTSTKPTTGRGDLVSARNHGLRLRSGRRKDLSHPLQRRRRGLPGGLRRGGQRGRGHRWLRHFYRPHRPGRTSLRRARDSDQSEFVRDQRQPLYHYGNAGRRRLLVLFCRGSRGRAQFLSANTFQLSDPSVTYTLQLDGNDLPSAVVADFTVKPSRDLLLVDDDVYVITYNSSPPARCSDRGNRQFRSSTPPSR